MSSELTIKEEYLADSARVSITGEIDIYTAQLFKEKLYNVVDSSGRDLNIDCSNLNYIDSTGLGIFVGALKKTKVNGKEIYLENLKDNIKKLFVITGLDKLFIIK
jgi:anti-sigma B factor antagonist